MAAQIQSQADQLHDTTLEQLGASSEQIGRIKGIDADYGRFAETIHALDPRSEKFGEQAADALFGKALANPENAVQFTEMAREAGKLPEFRQHFIENVINETKGAGGGPVNQMKAMRKIQDKWGSSEAGSSVLKTVFGKDSPMADPVQASKVLGALDNGETRQQTRAERAVVGKVLHGWRDSRYSPPSWAARRGASIHIPKVATTDRRARYGGVGGHIMARMSPQATELYEDAAQSFAGDNADFLARAGATLTGMEAQPNVP